MPEAGGYGTVIGLTLGSVSLVVGWLIWKRPMASMAVVARTLLHIFGFRRITIAASPGRIVYFRAGSGPPLVLLHGVNDHAGTWVAVAPALARRYRVVAPDLAGHGDSAPRVGPLEPRDLLAGVAEVVKAEAQGQPVTFIGNSLGGGVALLYALEHPTEVAHVILVNGVVGRAPFEAAATLLPRTREEARRAMAALSSPRSPRVPGFVLDDLVRRAPESPLARLLAHPEASLTRYLTIDRLDAVRVPVTIIWGRDDDLLLISEAREALQRLRRSRLVILPDCGHIPQRECPRALLRLLKEILAQPLPGRSDDEPARGVRRA